MHRKNLLFNDGGNRQAVETVNEGPPQFNPVPAFTCEKVSYHLINLETTRKCGSKNEHSS
jgi:hypothetical protein